MKKFPFCHTALQEFHFAQGAATASLLRRRRIFLSHSQFTEGNGFREECDLEKFHKKTRKLPIYLL
jgi:hypothetical protein